MGFSLSAAELHGLESRKKNCGSAWRKDALIWDERVDFQKITFRSCPVEPPKMRYKRTGLGSRSDAPDFPAPLFMPLSTSLRLAVALPVQQLAAAVTLGLEFPVQGHVAAGTEIKHLIGGKTTEEQVFGDGRW